MSRRARAFACLLLGLPIAACGTSKPPALATVSDGRYSMGTVLELTLVGPGEPGLRAALDALFAEAVRMEGLFSSFDAASGVSQLNAAAGRGPVVVAPELALILARSAALTQLTRGAFDVAIGPLLALWEEAGARGELPSRPALEAARRRSGVAHLRVLAGDRVELTEGSHLNLSGVAKGFALDRMLPRLRAAGARAALLSFGQSSVWALGAPPGAVGWRLLARAPGGGFLGVLTLRDRALSVSGSLGHFVEIHGRRLGHVLDPRTGEPLEAESLALVVAPDATLAEALSKALLVLGPREGLALVAAQPGCEALLADAAGPLWRSRGWDASVRWEPAAPGPAQDEPARGRSPGRGPRPLLPDL